MCQQKRSSLTAATTTATEISIGTAQRNRQTHKSHNTTHRPGACTALVTLTMGDAMHVNVGYLYTLYIHARPHKCQYCRTETRTDIQTDRLLSIFTILGFRSTEIFIWLTQHMDAGRQSHTYFANPNWFLLFFDCLLSSSYRRVLEQFPHSVGCAILWRHTLPFTHITFFKSKELFLSKIRGALFLITN